MWKCNRCGDLKSEDEMSTYRDFGANGEQSYIDTDCSCGGTYEEAKQCKDCGEYFCEDELYDGLCEDCLVEYVEDYAVEDLAEDYGSKNKETVKINGYLAYVFSEDEIEEILRRELAEALNLGVKSKAKNYCLYDKDDFAKFINKKEK